MQTSHLEGFDDLFARGLLVSARTRPRPFRLCYKQDSVPQSSSNGARRDPLHQWLLGGGDQAGIGVFLAARDRRRSGDVGKRALYCHGSLELGRSRA